MLSLFQSDPAGFFISILAILIALTVHEWAHAMTAYRLGDPTAEHNGRLSLNPLAHIDPLGAMMFLVARIGWAKPVPVNPAYFARPKRDSALVALAGPVSNLILAFAAAATLSVLAHTLGGSVRDAGAALVLLVKFAQAFLQVNLGLMAFNLLPIAPLDGSKVIQPWIPWRYEERYTDFLRIGPYILLFLLIFESFLPVQPVSWWVSTVADGVLRAFEIIL